MVKKRIIEIVGLEKRFGDVKAINGLDLTIQNAELFGLLGPNGAGKSTTIKILCGLLPPSRGSATIAGFDVEREASRVKGLIGVCPQEPAVFPYLTGRENIEFFGSLSGMSRVALKHNANELIEKLSLTGDADRRVKGYSGGMKRRVSLAAALVSDPEIAFLDEPTVGMDPQSRIAVWDFIRGLKAKKKTVILTTHYMEEAQDLCDRVAIIDQGRLIAIGRPAELMERFSAKNLEEVFLTLTGRQMREGS